MGGRWPAVGQASSRRRGAAAGTDLSRVTLSVGATRDVRLRPMGPVEEVRPNWSQYKGEPKLCVPPRSRTATAKLPYNARCWKYAGSRTLYLEYGRSVHKCTRGCHERGAPGRGRQRATTNATPAWWGVPSPSESPAPKCPPRAVNTFRPEPSPNLHCAH